MSERASVNPTTLLDAARQGDPQAFRALYEMVYEELRRLAGKLRQGRGADTLNTTALVHEAFVRLVPYEAAGWENRCHFFRTAAQAMRFVLVDYARKRKAAKRGGHLVAVTFNEHVHAATVQAEGVLALHEALKQLETLDPRQAQIVECRYFAGLTIEDTAQALGISVATVKRDWRSARAWLAQSLRA